MIEVKVDSSAALHTLPTIALPNDQFCRGGDDASLDDVLGHWTGKIFFTLHSFQSKFEHSSGRRLLNPGIGEQEDAVVAPNPIMELLVNSNALWVSLSCSVLLSCLVKLAVLGKFSARELLRLIYGLRIGPAGLSWDIVTFVN